jgi:PAS domain S-box-containing protein
MDPAVEDVTGYSLDGFYKRSALIARLIHPLDRPKIELLLRGELDLDHPITIRWNRKDGASFWSEIEAAYIEDAAGRPAAVEGFIRKTTPMWKPEISFQMLLEADPDVMLVVRTDGRVLYVNRQVEALLGYQPAELEGQQVERLLPERFRDRHIVYRADYAKAPSTRPMGIGVDLFASCKDGREIPVEVSLSPFPFKDDHLDEHLVIATVRDVSERKRAEASARENEHRFRLLVDNVRDYALYLLDRDGRIESWNPGAGRMYGYHADEIVGQHLSRFYLPEDQAAGLPQQHLDLADATGRSEEEGWRVRKDGTRFFAIVTTTPVLDDSGSLRGFAKVVNDVTERRKIREELQRLLTEEQRLRTAADSALRVRDQLLAFASHDLRNLVAAINLHLQLLRKLGLSSFLPSELASEVTEDLTAIEQGVARVTALAGELNDVAHLEMGERLSLRREPVDLVALTDKALAALRRTAGACRFRLVAPAEPVVGNWDPARIERVLQNLLTNAVKYSGDECDVIVTIRQDPDPMAELCVEDHGIGIVADDLPQIMQGFKRGRNVGGEIAGSGLGLAGSRKIIEQHGGTLEIESEEGRGTRVTVRLPFA